MIRYFPSNKKTNTRTDTDSQAYACAAMLAITLIFALPAPAAFGQTGYLTRDPNVAIDMSVLEELGLPATVAGQHIPSTIVIRPPVLFPPAAPPVSRLTGSLLNRRLSPQPAAAPRAQSLAPPRPRAAPPPTDAVRAPEPFTPVTVDIPVAEPAVPVSPAMAPPAPTPAPTATRSAAVEDKVVVAAPPPPVAAPQPDPEPASLPAAPAAIAETPAAPALTPSPTGSGTAAPVQTAARPAGDTLEPSFRVLFDEKSAKISDAARVPLQELSNRMKESEDLRVQLLAYTEGTSETASQARRLSLSRALAVRSFLINQGVRSTRMDVRALGNKAEIGPSDRVDAVLVER